MAIQEWNIFIYLTKIDRNIKIFPTMFSPQASLVVGERKKQVIASLSNIIKTYFTFR